MAEDSTGDRTKYWLKVVGGLALFFAILLPDQIPSLVQGGKPLDGVAQRTLAASALVAFWWMTGPISLAATSLLPLVLYPLLGVMSAKEVSAGYVNDSIHLYMGGFILALGIERWKLHRRIALWVLVLVGAGSRRIVLGMMTATAFLSMWISNTATTLLMLPIAIALVDSFESRFKNTEIDSEERRHIAKFATALLLGIAYAASAGGVGTLIGSPTNLVFVGMSSERFPDAPPISFSDWMFFCVPFSVVMVLMMWWLMAPADAKRSAESNSLGKDIIHEELQKLGPMSSAERRMLVIFACTAVLWITRASVSIGEVNLPGWSKGLEYLAQRIGWTEFKASMVSDTTVAIAMSAIMFFWPAGNDHEGERLMNWETAVKLPWGILLLIGGGFTIGNAFQSAGVSEWVGSQFLVVSGWSPIAMVAGVCFSMTFLTEITSNVATTSVMLPILAGSAETLGVHPWLLMIPATISASCAFMLPVATPPNAIVFGSGRVQMADMVRYGIIINLIGVVAVTALMFLLAVPILGIEATAVPSWAK